MTIGELISLGGWMMAPLAVCSLVAVAVTVRKLTELPPRDRGDWLERALDQLRAGNVEAARSACRAGEQPVARALAAGLEVVDRRPDRFEAEVGRVGSRELQRAERHLGLLAFVAQAAPLLGLLGTVVGMVQLFWGMESGGASSAAVSSGIWQALLTTAAGLAIAVPTLAAHAYLASRSDQLRLALHDAVERALTALPGDRGAAG